MEKKSQIKCNFCSLTHNKNWKNRFYAEFKTIFTHDSELEKLLIALIKPTIIIVVAQYFCALFPFCGGFL